jgi:hypothetical protein
MTPQVFSGTSAAGTTGAAEGGGMVGVRGMTGTRGTTEGGATGSVGVAGTGGGPVGVRGWRWPLQGVSPARWACSVGAGGRGADVKCLGRERPIRERLMG